MRKEKGITLISLVVTIIVLIILAGISINLILGQDGIINKVKEAKQNMEYAQIEEQEQLNELYEQMETNYSGVPVGSIEKLVEFKKAIADYIESKNVDRPESAGDASVYINSFEEVLTLATKVDETVAATSEDIAEGKKAWVNGSLITGIKVNTTERKEATGTITAKGQTTVVCGFRPRIVSFHGGWTTIWIEPDPWFGDEHLYGIAISNSTVYKKALGDKLIINDDGFTFTTSSSTYETTWYASE